MHINSRPILIIGSHRGGTTWVGKTIGFSPWTYYIGEVFNRKSQLLTPNILVYDYQYITPEINKHYEEQLEKILAFNFVWPNRRGFRSLIPSRLKIIKHFHNWIGFPRPILKDPLASMSAEWLSQTFEMDVICLVRHPAAFIYSLKKIGWRFDFHQFLNQPQLIDDLLHPFVDQFHPKPKDIIEEGALLWKCIYHVLSIYLQRNPEWGIFWFEDIASDPIASFKNIYERLGLNYPTWIQHRINSYSNKNNPVEAPKNDPFSIRRDSKKLREIWKTELTGDEITRIRLIVEPVSSQYYKNSDWH